MIKLISLIIRFYLKICIFFGFEIVQFLAFQTKHHLNIWFDNDIDIVRKKKQIKICSMMLSVQLFSNKIKCTEAKCKTFPETIKGFVASHLTHKLFQITTNHFIH